MTNHIEEMMKTANVEKQLGICMQCLKEDICEYCNKKSLGVYVYPDFTAEKQLEVIKLIGNKGSFGLQNGRYITGGNGIQNFKSIDMITTDFTQALAQLTIELMKTGELDKEKVKGILEG